jgi:hypothetical protein
MNQLHGQAKADRTSSQLSELTQTRNNCFFFFFFRGGNKSYPDSRLLSLVFCCEHSYSSFPKQNPSPEVRDKMSLSDPKLCKILGSRQLSD